MKSKLSLMVVCVFAVLSLSACEQDLVNVRPDAPAAEAGGLNDALAAAKKSKKGPQKPGKPPAPVGTTYEISVPDDPDPLFRFTISGNSIQLESDPSVASWGSDYWGYWSDPFELGDDAVTYTFGLSTTTYALTPQPDGTLDVTRTVVVQPYLGGSPTTTVSHVGAFTLLN